MLIPPPKEILSKTYNMTISRTSIRNLEDITGSHLCSYKQEDGHQWSNANISRGPHKDPTHRDPSHKGLTLLDQEAATSKSQEEDHLSLLQRLGILVADHNQADALHLETYTEAKVQCDQEVRTLVVEAQVEHSHPERAVSVNNSHRLRFSSTALRLHLR